ncbi:MAG TPA: hypothetical protein EYP59_14480 [Thiotrichaceae bacterium]|nr:hypothetical protein [Thiotrichaceae bacterium]
MGESKLKDCQYWQEKIKGYRDLSNAEIELMNQVKTKGAEIGDLISMLSQNKNLDQRWVEIGKTQVQQGLMALTRGITQPNFF